MNKLSLITTIIRNARYNRMSKSICIHPCVSGINQSCCGVYTKSRQSKNHILICFCNKNRTPRFIPNKIERTAVCKKFNILILT